MTTDDERKLRFETLAVHAGAEPDAATGAVTPPIHPSTTFVRAADGSYPHGWVYTRSGNPTRDRLERALATLETGGRGGSAAAFASGSAAAGAVFRALPVGSRAIVPDDMYHGIRRLLREGYADRLELVFVDTTDLGAVEAALVDGAELVWLETPSNPLLKVSDIAAVAERAHAAGAAVALDATWTPPPLQPALELGADLVVHATTKYLGGHSDVLGGVVIAASEDAPLFERVRFFQLNEGAVPSPFDCWLTLRGLRTLPWRMRAHCSNARTVAEYLRARPEVARVNYPGLDTHPQHAVAATQMRDFGGMLSFEVEGGREAAMAVAAALQVFVRATSLGGPESLVEHRASIEGPGSATPPGLLRLSVGLEHPDDLIADLERGLAAAADPGADPDAGGAA